MLSEPTFYLGLLVVAAGVALGIARFSWANRGQSGAVPLTVLMLALAEWTLLYAFQLSRSAFGTDVLVMKLQYVGIVTVPVAWFYFVLEYTGRSHYLTRRRLALLLAVPSLTVCFALSNGLHGLMWRSVRPEVVGPFTDLTSSHGPWFAVHTTYSYLLVLAGTILLLQMLVLSDHVYRGQALLLLGGAFIPWVSNVVYLSGVLSVPIDPTPFAFVLTGVCYAGTIARHKLLNAVPIAREVARDEVIQGMVDGVIILDRDVHVVDFNPAAQHLLDPTRVDVVGEPLACFLPTLADSLSGLSHNASVKTELSVRGDAGIFHYDVHLSTLERGYGLVSGYLVNLHEITHRKRRVEHLDVLNRLLRHNLRNELNVVQGNVELVRTSLTDDQLSARLATAIDKTEQIVERSDKLERVSRDLDAERRTLVDVAAVLEDVVETSRVAHPQAAFTVGVSSAHVRAGASIHSAFAELLENAVEHAERDDPTVVVSLDREGEEDEEMIVVRIADDGPGIPSHEIETLEAEGETPLRHSSGVGLWITAWIVRSVGGELDIAADVGGSTVTVRLPRARQSETGRVA